MPFIDYNRDVPNPPNTPAVDVPKMKVNTNSTDDILVVDHFSFKDNLGGYHKQVHLVNEAAPGLGTASSALYTNVSNSQSWPFWQNLASGSPFQLAGISDFTSPTETNGYVYVSGLLVQFGFIAQTPGAWPTTVQVYSFSTNTKNINYPNKLVAVFLQPIGGTQSNQSMASSVYLTTGFSWKASIAASNNTGFIWLAIGN